MVIGIIAILMGIVTTAASSSIRSMRVQRATALCTLVQAGLEAYREQFGKWPVDLPATRTNQEGPNGQNDPEKIVLDKKEIQSAVFELVRQTKEGNPLMDISGLFVSRSDGEPNSGAAFGLDFMSAIHGTRDSQKKMSVGEMYFGYPEESHGWFRRFKMVYSIPSDSIKVSKQ